MRYSRFQIGRVIVEYDLFNTTTFICPFWFNFDTVLCPFLETGT